MAKQSDYPLKNNPDGTETVTAAEGTTATKKIPLNKFPVSEPTQVILNNKAESVHVHPAAEIDMPVLGTPTYTTLVDQSNIIRSTGVIDGGGIQNNGNGTVKVLAGSGILRATNDLLAELVSLDWAEAPSIALTDKMFNHIYLEYNSGTPQLVADPTGRTDFQTNILLGGVYRDGNEIHLTPQIREDVLDTTKRLIRRFEDTQPFQHASGSIISGVGTRGLKCTAGLFKIGLNDVPTILQDTSGASPDGNHTFEYFYLNAGNWITHETTVAAAAFTGSGLDDASSGGTFVGSHTIRIHAEIDANGTPDTFKWSYKDNDGATIIEVIGVPITAGPINLADGVSITFAATTGHTIGDAWDFDCTLSNQIDNTQYSTGSGLAALGVGRYGVHWVYLDTHGHLAVIFGDGSYTLSQAEDALAPASLPPEFEHHVRLIGRIIIRKNESTFTLIENNYGISFQTAVATSHDGLADVQGGITDEHFHLSQAELTKVQGINPATLSNIAALTALTEASLTDGDERYIDTEQAIYIYKSSLDYGDEAPDDQTSSTGFWLDTRTERILVRTGEAITVGDICYIEEFNDPDDSAFKASKTNAYSSTLIYAEKTASGGVNSVPFILRGRVSSLNVNISANAYLGPTAGNETDTRPNASGDHIRVIGYGLDNGRHIFDPEPSYQTIIEGVDIEFTPDGDIAATDLQAAIVEVRDDADTKLALKAPITSPVFIGDIKSAASGLSRGFFMRSNDEVVTFGNYLEISLGAASATGLLTVSSTLTSALYRTSKTYFITMRYGGFVLTQLGTGDGTSGSSPFSVTNPSANNVRVTNDHASSSATITMNFVGLLGV